MNLQIRSMFDTELTSAKLTSSRKTLCKATFFFQWNTQSLNPTLQKRRTLETRTPNDTHPHSRRTVPQDSGDNSPQRGGMPQPKSETTDKNRTHQHYKKKHTTQPRSSTTRVHAQSHLHNVGYSYPRCIQKTSKHKNKKKASDPRARFEHTEVPHTRQVFHGDLHPMSPTKHMA